MRGVVARATIVAVVVAVSAMDAGGYVLTGNSWGIGASVTFSFKTTPPPLGIDETPYGRGSSSGVRVTDFLGAGWEADVLAAFDTWTAVADISFLQVGDNNRDFDDAAASGEIRIVGHVFDGVGGEYAHSYEPPPFGVTASGDIHLDSDEIWHTGAGAPGPGEFDLYSVMLHEIGHAIGLGDTSDPSSVMYSSYWYNSAESLSMDDIIGSRAIYGAAEGSTPEPETLLIIGAFLALAVFLRNSPSERAGAGRSNSKAAGG